MTSSYGTTTDADTYFTARANSAWTGDDAAKAAALLRGSEYIDGKYHLYFPGIKTGGRSQEREWPRTSAEDYSGAAIDAAEVPREVEYATYEAAVRELAAPGSLLPDVTLSELVISESVGPLKTDYALSALLRNRGASNTGPETSHLLPTVTIIERLIEPVITASRKLPGIISV